MTNLCSRCGETHAPGSPEHKFADMRDIQMMQNARGDVLVTPIVPALYAGFDDTAGIVLAELEQDPNSGVCRRD